MRSLILVPIVHSPEDLGTLRDSIRDTYVAERGQGEWNDYVKSVEKLWKAIRHAVDSLALEWPRVRLYQDGLPVCDHVESIVRELAAKGSENHRLLVELIDRGAILTGTESPQLLVDEYAFNRRMLEDRRASREFARSPRLERRARKLLDDRDRFIAGQIGRTLESGEQGLIFLGMLHSLDGRLPRDITLTIRRP